MSHTQTITTERPHDHLYDTNYIVSSQVDHDRALKRAAAAQVEPVPRFDNMFSDVQNYQRVSYRTKVDKRKLAPVHVKAMTHAEVVQMAPPEKQPEVAGKDRHAFFRRPIVPLADSQEIPDTMIRVAPVEPVDTAPVPRLPTPPSRTVGTMTDFRDSETQTDPFSPDYFVPDDVVTEPEVLLLTDFRFGQAPGVRLPAGEADIEAIERLRDKREFQKRLPEIVLGETDKKTFALRQAMLEEIERQEFEEHEAAIDEELDARMQHIQHRLMKRDAENQRLKQERIERIWRERYDSKERALMRVQHRRIKTMRKLACQHGDAEGKREKRDIIADFADFGSRLYAPRLRDGFGQKKAKTKDSNPQEQASTVAEALDLRSMDVLAKELPNDLFESSVSLPSRTLNRQEQQMEAHLERMEGTLKRHREVSAGFTKDEATQLSLLQRRKPKEAPRPPTPERVHDGIDNAMSDAVILLQRLLAGRAVQELMFAGKERRRQLIEELRVEEEVGGEMDERSILLDEQKVDSVLAAVQAGVTGDMLDFGAKELERNGEERRIFEMGQELERARRIREAIETGRRQKELIQRSKRDERFRQLARLQQFTEDSLVTAALSRAVMTVATEQAENEAIAQAQEELANPQPAMPAEREVRALLESFVIPETRRQTDDLRDTSEKRFVVAGHRATQTMVQKAMEKAGITE